ncbi:hypothetical protein Q9Q94_03195 [Uliginosibacterium sp. 31-16]|uniref:hypothetical protein n=1 Tax=Uliginosibacterium sp. 31-16 TaxID=3068315 RepID=UPI00273F3B7E|nr:hypothetical protein [Uliginosibacterium sp. 31-16]MDP5238516.1 hypothetical protein [Uliginosibacterium sp. 31-16]
MSFSVKIQKDALVVRVYSRQIAIFILLGVLLIVLGAFVLSQVPVRENWAGALMGGAVFICLGCIMTRWAGLRPTAVAVEIRPQRDACVLAMTRYCMLGRRQRQACTCQQIKARAIHIEEERFPGEDRQMIEADDYFEVLVDGKRDLWEKLLPESRADFCPFFSKNEVDALVKLINTFAKKGRAATSMLSADELRILGIQE